MAETNPSDEKGEDIGEAAMKKAAAEALEKALAIQADVFQRASAYINLLTLGGYAGAFAIWGYAKSGMNPKGTALVALLLTISLAVFIAYEVYKMIFMANCFRKWWSALRPNRTPQQTLDAIRQLEADQKRRPFVGLLWIWIVAVVLAVGTALGALILLFYSSAAVLFGFPKWP